MAGKLRYLLDTNVLSEWVKPRPDDSVLAALQCREAECATSAHTHEHARIDGDIRRRPAQPLAAASSISSNPVHRSTNSRAVNDARDVALAAADVAISMSMPFGSKE